MSDADTGAPFHPLRAEATVAEALRGVQLVFETGFPADLVDLADRVVEVTARSRSLVTGGRVRYPASWAMTVISLARDYDGSSFWQSEPLGVFGKDPVKTADLTLQAMESAGLDLFREATRVENALRKLTPVLMHAGVPAANVGEVVKQIGSAIRAHQYAPEDQIAYWQQRTNGFGNIWRAPQILFKHGGAIAEDLLEQINVAISDAGPEASGLPIHLAEAVASLDPNEIRSARGRSGARVPRPQFRIDPFDLAGPKVLLPRATVAQADRWELVGSVERSAVASDFDREIAMQPEGLWAVRASRAGDPVLRVEERPYRELPVSLFDGRFPHALLRRTKQRVNVPGRSLIAVVPEGIEIDGGAIVDRFPSLVGSWHGHDVIEIDVHDVTGLVFRSTQGNDQRTENVVIERPPARPRLLPDAAVAGVRSSRGGLVFASPPVLHWRVAGAAATAVEVVVEAGDIERTSNLSEVDALGDDSFDLSGIVPEGRECSISLRGPLGARMRSTQIAVVPELKVEQRPALAGVGEEATIRLWTRTGTTEVSAGVDAADVAAMVDGVALTVEVRRARWALRTAGDLNPTLASRVFSLGADDLLGASTALLSVDLGTAMYSRVELRDGSKTLQQIENPHVGQRGWTANLSMLTDTVRSASTEALDLVLVAADRSVLVGRIVSQYVPTILSVRADPAIEPAVVELAVEENRPFGNRCVRIWNLDRPWEPSRRVPLGDADRGTISIQFEAGHRRGRYRCWLRVEDPWASEPHIPSPDVRGVCDVEVLAGRDLDPVDPIDRVIGAAQGRAGFEAEAADIAAHGDVAIALLNGCHRDAGVSGLSSRLATSVLRALDAAPEATVASLFSAVNERRIDASAALPISLALLPTILANEALLDLELDDEIADEVWSQLPLIAAAVEAWDENPAAYDRWSRALGWPAVPGVEAADAPNGNEDALPTPHRAVPDEDFTSSVRFALARPALRELLNDMVGALSRQPLTLDGQMRAVAAVVAAASDRPAAVAEWRDRYDRVITANDGYALSGRGARWVSALTVQGVDEGFPLARWLLADLFVLARALVLSTGEAINARDALLDACAFAQEWVAFCLLLVLAEDEHRRKHGVRLVAVEEEELDDA